MARKKQEPKPISSVRFDFVEALENVCGQAIMLLQAVDAVLKHGDLKEGVKQILQERHDAMKRALIGDE